MTAIVFKITEALYENEKVYGENDVDHFCSKILSSNCMISLKIAVS